MLWEHAAARALFFAVIVATAPGTAYVAHWHVPRMRVLYRMPFDEYRSRLERLRQMPRRPRFSQLPGAASSVLGAVLTGWSLLFAVSAVSLGSNMSAEFWRTFYLLLGLALVSMAFSTYRLIEVFVKVDAVLLNESFSARLRHVALVYAVAGAVLLSISFVSRAEGGVPG